MALLDDLDRGLLDLIFPRDCVVTREPMELGPRRHLSAAGALELARVDDPRCLRCGHPFDGTLEDDRSCPHCVGLNPAFGRAVCPFRARGPVRDIIHRVKYGASPWLADDLADAALEDMLFRRHLSGAILVPVPLHAARRRERGYNQAERIAAWLAPRLPGCAVATLLVKQVATLSQTRLDRRERRANVRRAFRLAAGATIDPDRRYVVIDDVLTTGATLHACAATLRAAGAGLVDAAALAHG
ncbi:ComF family protein [bacterium]|jgi:competence protein ComFC|nr:ComF family protein [bacterium]